MNTLFLLLCLSLPAQHDRVDVIELNRVYGSDGKEALCQYVFWNVRCVDFDADYHVVDWRLYSHVDARPTSGRDGYRLEWFDQKGHFRVVGSAFWERHSDYDVEIKDRDVVKCENRKGLTKVK